MGLDPADKLPPALARFGGWAYRQPPAVPAILPGVPHGVLVGPRGTDCCTMTAWVLLAAYPELRAHPKAWADLCIWDADRRWSPIECAVAAGIGTEQPIVALGWYIVQSWGQTTGHARICEVRDDGLMVYDASRTAGQVRARLLPLGAHRTCGTTRAVRLS